MQDNFIKKYHKLQNKKIMTLIFLFVLIIFLMMYFVSLGVSNSCITEVFYTLKKLLFNENLNTNQKIILNLRFPRIILAILAGMGLSGAGTIMQGITRNPLVSPFTVGISSAASFGASLAIVFGFSFFGNSEIGIVTNAFIFSLLCTILVFLISSKLKLSSQAIILTGIALNYFCQALSAGVQFLADDTTLSKVIHWTFGSLNGSEYKEVYIVAIILIPSAFILFLYNKYFSMMSVNDDETLMTMGINSKKMRIIGGTLCSLITASIISFTGVIGFVGLASPHISRFLIGNDFKFLLPCSFLVGAILVLVADTIGRILFSPIIIPVGIVISFLGVPIFLWQILSKERY